jgi:hypothetical protein
VLHSGEAASAAEAVDNPVITRAAAQTRVALVIAALGSNTEPFEH